MKKLLGAVIVLLCLTLAVLGGLRVWGVSIFSSYTLLRSGLTLGILAATLVLLIIIRFAFFSNPAAGYDARQGNRAHPRQ